MFRLQDMRDAKKLKWLLYILFAIVIVSFVFFYGWQASDPTVRPEDQVFARLRSESLNPLKRWISINSPMLKRAQSSVQFSKLPSVPRELQAQLFRSGGLDRIITTAETAVEAADQILLRRQADAMGVYVSQEEIIDDFRAQPNMNDRMLERFARQYDTDKRGYIELQRQTREVQRVLNIQTLLAHASLFELWQEYVLINEQIKFQMAGYPARDFEDQVVVTDQDLESYLAANMDTFRKPPQRRYAYIKLTKKDLTDQIEFTDEQLQVYYEQNQADYLRQAAYKVDEIFVSLSGDTVTTQAVAALTEQRPMLAALDDWSTVSQVLKAQRPELGYYFREGVTWLERDSAARSPEYMERIQALSDDQVSTPIVESSGVILARIAERRAEGTPPLEEIRPDVEQDYLTEQTDDAFEEKFISWKEEIRHHTTLRSFGQKVGLDDELTTRVAADAFFIPDVGSVYADRDHVMSLWMNDRQPKLSDVLRTPDQLTVLEVVEKLEAYDPPLEEVRLPVERMLRNERAAELAEASARQGLGLIEGGADFETALAEAPRAPFTTDPVKRTDRIGDLGGTLIGLTQETLGLKVGSTGVTPYGFNADNVLGYAVWKVLEMEEPTQEQFAEDRRDFSGDYLDVQRHTVRREWLADLRDAAEFELTSEQDQEDDEQESDAESDAAAADTAPDQS